MDSLLILGLIVAPVLIMTTIIHELGHYVSAKNKGYKPSIHFKRFNLVTRIPELENKEHIKKIAQDGITAGFIFILFLSLLNDVIGPYLFLLFLLYYVVGVWSDIKLINKLRVK